MSTPAIRRMPKLQPGVYRNRNQVQAGSAAGCMPKPQPGVCRNRNQVQAGSAVSPAASAEE